MNESFITMKRTIFLLLVIIAFTNAEARQPKRGYRGFLEWSSSVRSDNFGVFDMNWNLTMERQSMFYTGFSTSHGYQINPMFFIGAGLGMERYGKLEHYEGSMSGQDSYEIQYVGTKRHIRSYFSFRIGIDF